ncbi:branched-chain amino acid ABC transporter permease [Halopenitus salinus]|uniref:Branched-chain amino acid ABC transporter permease n=1 Tax=Halopenitus salinus TaxID=1198295 RepID=A0ABD5UUY7_9EURY
MSTDSRGRFGFEGVLDALGHPRVYLPLLLAVGLLPLPRFVPSFYVHISILVFLIGSCAVAWNIIGGFGGQFSLGNAMFLGIGAYATSILIMTHGMSAWVGMGVGILLAVLAAIVVGYPSFLLTGHYFALATIAVVEGLWYLAIHFSDLTGGSAGLSVYGDPGWTTLIFPNRAPYFYLAYALFLGSIAVSIYIRYSRLGYYLLAIRENQQAAESIGINTTRSKIYGFIISAVITSIAGSLYAVYIQFLSPGATFSLDLSIQFALATLIGGIGTIAGPIVGTLLLIPLEEYATTVLGGQYGALSYIGYGVVLILFIIYAPEGLVERLRFVGDRIESAAPNFSSRSEPTAREETDD